MTGEYKINIPLEDTKTMPRMSSRGKHAVAWRRHWHNLLAICKSLKKSRIRYEVEFRSTRIGSSPFLTRIGLA